jgi:hypothetical protein
MVWDLRGALLKKQETETARLVDFEFRLRVRAMRALADALGMEAEPLVRAVVRHGDAPILAELAQRTGLEPGVIAERHAACRAEARAALIREMGDPSPHRLA